MYGIVTRNEPELTWPEFDRAFFECKDVTGRAAEPVSDGINMISCFGDNAAVEGDPQLAQVSESGDRATRDRPYFDWDYVCPTNEEYRRGLVEMIDDAVAENDDLRLDDVGFAREEYCHCERCTRQFEASEFDDWMAWRADLITGFVRDARERVPGDLLLTLYPDPYGDHLYRRSGLDLAELEHLVDEFVVPLYDTAYGTTYWLETIASGFADRLETPVTVELYAVNVDIDNLIHAAEVAGEYADSVLFGYDASNARAALRRMQADERDGESHTPLDDE